METTVPKKTKVDYAKIYETWDDLPNVRLCIPGESFWGKELPDGTYGVNNSLLTTAYRWQDIVRSTRLSEKDAKNLIIHRRWHTDLNFGFVVVEGSEEENLAQRQKILDALKPLGRTSFWMDGIARIYMEKKLSDEEGLELVRKALEAVGVEFDPLEENDE